MLHFFQGTVTHKKRRSEVWQGLKLTGFGTWGWGSRVGCLSGGGGCRTNWICLKVSMLLILISSTALMYLSSCAEFYCHFQAKGQMPNLAWRALLSVSVTRRPPPSAARSYLNSGLSSLTRGSQAWPGAFKADQGLPSQIWMVTLDTFRFQILDFRFWISDFGCQIWKILGSGFRFRISDSGFQISDFGYQISKFGF